MYEIVLKVIETYGVDHIASFCIVVQLTTVGTGIAAHHLRHVIVYVFRRVRQPLVQSPPPETITHSYSHGAVKHTRRYTDLCPPRR